MRPQILICFVALALISLAGEVSAKKNRDLHHGHSGLLKPYESGPIEVKLGKDDEKALDAGKPVMKQVENEGEAGGGAICVQDVEAPKEAVWSQILDFDIYKGKVPKVNECKNYVVKSNPDGTHTIKTKMVIGVLPGYSYTSYYDHKYDSAKDSCTWTLDYDKTSDFNDVAGHWHVEDHPEKPECTRVFYACDVKLKGAIPGPVANYLSKSALRSATGWVKKESEKNPAGKIPEEFKSESPAFIQ